ncbi:MAG: hypothetical protein ACD_2C00073G0001, partial [uncultured bacterium (gcode 4)]
MKSVNQVCHVKKCCGGRNRTDDPRVYVPARPHL